MFISFDEYLSTLPIIKIGSNLKMESSTSKGNQSKWYLPQQHMFVKESFYHQGRSWKDYICEELAYNVGLQFGLNMAVTKACRLGSESGSLTPGSYSKNFLGPDETFESFRSIQKSCHNIYIRKDFLMQEPDAIFKTLCEQFSDTCSMDAQSYLSYMFLLDYLIGNEDRHLNNFGVVFTPSTGQYKLAPIFDNGLSLLEHDVRYERMSAKEALYATNQRPFNTRFDIVYKQIPHATNGSTLKICDMTTLVFPSQKAYEYFQLAAHALSIPLLGEPLIVKE